jgi:hypothetical protein
MAEQAVPAAAAEVVVVVVVAPVVGQGSMLVQALEDDDYRWRRAEDPVIAGEAHPHIAALEEDLVHDCRVGHLGNLPRMVVVDSSFEGVVVAVAVEVHEEHNVPNTPVVGAVDSAADRDCMPHNTVEEDLRVWLPQVGVGEVEGDLEVHIAEDPATADRNTDQEPYDQEVGHHAWTWADTEVLGEGNILLDDTQVEVQDHMRSDCWDQGILPAVLDRGQVEEHCSSSDHIQGHDEGRLHVVDVAEAFEYVAE